MFYYVGAKLKRKRFGIERDIPSKREGKTSYFAWYEKELPWGGPEEKKERTRILEHAKSQREMWNSTNLLKEIEADSLNALASKLMDITGKWEGPEFKKSGGKTYDKRDPHFIINHYTLMPYNLFSPPETALMYIKQKTIPTCPWDTHFESTPRRNLDLREQNTLANAILKELLQNKAEVEGE